jgi:putative SOS response-associated peptidase YedK
MPAILRPDDYAKWLDNDTRPKKLLALLKPYPTDLMETWPVDPMVNKATVEGADLVPRIDAA